MNAYIDTDITIIVWVAWRVRVIQQQMHSSILLLLSTFPPFHLSYREFVFIDTVATETISKNITRVWVRGWGVYLCVCVCACTPYFFSRTPNPLPFPGQKSPLKESGWVGVGGFLDRSVKSLAIFLEVH